MSSFAARGGAIGPARAQLAALEPLVARLEALELDKVALETRLEQALADEAYWAHVAARARAETATAIALAECDVAALRDERDAYARALGETEALWANELSLVRAGLADAREHIDALTRGRDELAGALALTLARAQFEFRARTGDVREERDAAVARTRRVDAEIDHERDRAEAQRAALAASLQSALAKAARLETDLAQAAADGRASGAAAAAAEARLGATMDQAFEADAARARARADGEATARAAMGATLAAAARREAAFGVREAALAAQLEGARGEAAKSEAETERLRAALDRQWRLGADAPPGAARARSGAVLSAEAEVAALRRDADELRRKADALARAETAGAAALADGMRTARELSAAQAELAELRGLNHALVARVAEAAAGGSCAHGGAPPASAMLPLPAGAPGTAAHAAATAALRAMSDQLVAARAEAADAQLRQMGDALAEALAETARARAAASRVPPLAVLPSDAPVVAARCSADAVRAPTIESGRAAAAEDALPSLAAQTDELIEAERAIDRANAHMAATRAAADRRPPSIARAVQRTPARAHADALAAAALASARARGGAHYHTAEQPRAAAGARTPLDSLLPRSSAAVARLFPMSTAALIDGGDDEAAARKRRGAALSGGAKPWEMPGDEPAAASCSEWLPRGRGARPIY